MEDKPSTEEGKQERTPTTAATWRKARAFFLAILCIGKLQVIAAKKRALRGDIPREIRDDKKKVGKWYWDRLYGEFCNETPEGALQSLKMVVLSHTEMLKDELPAAYGLGGIVRTRAGLLVFNSDTTSLDDFLSNIKGLPVDQMQRVGIIALNTKPSMQTEKVRRVNSLFGEALKRFHKAYEFNIHRRCSIAFHDQVDHLDCPPNEINCLGVIRPDACHVDSITPDASGNFRLVRSTVLPLHGKPRPCPAPQASGLIHYATLANNAGVVKWLIEQGCHKWLQSECGATALDIARKNNSRRILQILDPRYPHPSTALREFINNGGQLGTATDDATDGVDVSSKVTGTATFTSRKPTSALGRQDAEGTTTLNHNYRSTTPTNVARGQTTPRMRSPIRGRERPNDHTDNESPSGNNRGGGFQRGHGQLDMSNRGKQQQQQQQQQQETSNNASASPVNVYGNSTGIPQGIPQAYSPNTTLQNSNRPTISSRIGGYNSISSPREVLSKDYSTYTPPSRFPRDSAPFPNVSGAPPPTSNDYTFRNSTLSTPPSGSTPRNHYTSRTTHTQNTSYNSYNSSSYSSPHTRTTSPHIRNVTPLRYQSPSALPTYSSYASSPARPHRPTGSSQQRVNLSPGRRRMMELEREALARLNAFNSTQSPSPTRMGRSVF